MCVFGTNLVVLLYRGYYVVVEFLVANKEDVIHMKTDDPTDELPMRGASCDWICQRFYSLSFNLLRNVKLHLCASGPSTFSWSF